MIQQTIGRVAGGEHLTSSEMMMVMDQIMEGLWRPEQIGLFLLALRARGETVEEVVGAAQSLRAHMTSIHSRFEHFIDTCGTGGDGAGTFNISTAAAIVTAAMGLPVAKHGNRSISSKSGSSDVLQALGVNIEADVECVEKCLNEVGICFCFAPLMHHSMKNVAQVRRDLGVPTIFNLLGPLCNPASAPYQLMGVGRAELRPLMAEALQSLGLRRAVVVSGEDGLDEVTLGGATNVSISTPAGIIQTQWTPTDFGVQPADKSKLTVDGPAASAQRIREVLNGTAGAARDIVVVNAAAAFWTAQTDLSLRDCAARAEQAIDSGEANRRLLRLAEVSSA